VVNDYESDRDVLIEHFVFHDGQLVQESQGSVNIGAGSMTVDTQRIAIANPILWGVDDPNLYELKTSIIYHNQAIDELTTTIGIREIEFSADHGFSLNGENMKLKGICMHHDAGTLGAAVPKVVLDRRLDVLKEMGCNAIRTSHNPFSSDFYELCNEKGFLVIDEVFDEWEVTKKKWVEGWNQGEPSRDGYAENFGEWATTDLRDVVLRDRNHPSIIMWSIGNEVDYPNDPYSHPILNTEANPQTNARFDESLPHADRLGEIAAELAKVVRSLDVTRPVTAGLASALVSNETGYAAALDVAGYNYQEFRYEQDHERFPERPLYGSENGMSLEAWEAVANNDYIMGQFLWTGIEYLGEAWIYPYRYSTSGVIDLAGNKKNEFFFRQSLWSETPMVYMTVFDQPEQSDSKNLWAHRRGEPHWNWEGIKLVYVGVFSNSEEVELVLNGKSLGSKKMADFPSRVMSWEVPFEKGEIIAIGKRDGAEIARNVLISAGKPDRLTAKMLDYRSEVGSADVRQIEINVADADGNLVYKEDMEVICETIGPVKLLGLEDANPRNVEDYRSNKRHTFKGKLMAYFQVMDEAGGSAVITFSAEGLKPIAIEISN
jgi:hypothetical protein